MSFGLVNVETSMNENLDVGFLLFFNAFLGKD